MLNAHKYKFDRSRLESFYVAFITAKLEYAIIVWTGCTQEFSDLVEIVQYRHGKRLSVIRSTEQVTKCFLANLDGQASKVVDTNKC